MSHHQFTTHNLELLGSTLLDSLLDLCDPAPGKALAILAVLRDEVEQKARAKLKLGVNAKIRLEDICLLDIESDTEGSDSSAPSEDEALPEYDATPPPSTQSPAAQPAPAPPSRAPSMTSVLSHARALTRPTKTGPAIDVASHNPAAAPVRHRKDGQSVAAIFNITIQLTHSYLEQTARKPQHGASDRLRQLPLRYQTPPPRRSSADTMLMVIQPTLAKITLGEELGVPRESTVAVDRSFHPSHRPKHRASNSWHFVPK